MNKKWVRLLPLALIIIAVLLGLDQWAIYSR